MSEHKKSKVAQHFTDYRDAYIVGSAGLLAGTTSILIGTAATGALFDDTYKIVINRIADASGAAV